MKCGKFQFRNWNSPFASFARPPLPRRPPAPFRRVRRQFGRLVILCVLPNIKHIAAYPSESLNLLNGLVDFAFLLPNERIWRTYRVRGWV